MVNFNKYQKLLIICVCVLAVYWILLAISGQQNGFWNNFFSFLFSLIPLLGGLVACFLSASQGGLQSALGKGNFYLSLGHLTWGIGGMIWSYYIFFTNIPVPYPSLADLGFAVSLPLWMLGIFNLAIATGADLGWRNKKGKYFFLLLPLISVFISYYLLIIVGRGGVFLSTPGYFGLKWILDIVYLAGDILILSAVLLIYCLSLKFLGAIYKTNIQFILFGFCLMYLADFIFSYTTTIGTFFNGDFSDLLYCVALAIILYGVFGFYPVKRNAN